MTKNYLTALTDDSAIGARVRQKSEKDVGESCCQTNDVCEVAKRKWSVGKSCCHGGDVCEVAKRKWSVGESCCQTNDVCEVTKRKWSLCSVLKFGAVPRMIVSAKIGY